MSVYYRFQDVVKFEYDKTSVEYTRYQTLFQDVVKFEYDKTSCLTNYQ